jgi:hypothetical protein
MDPYNQDEWWITGEKEKNDHIRWKQEQHQGNGVGRKI